MLAEVPVRAEEPVLEVGNRPVNQRPLAARRDSTTAADRDMVVTFAVDTAIAAPAVSEQLRALADLLQNHTVQRLSVCPGEYLQVDMTGDIRGPLFDSHTDQAFGVGGPSRPVFAVAVASDIGLINLQDPVEGVSAIPVAHRQPQFMQQVEGSVIGYRQVLRECHGRDALLVGQQVDGQEHLR